MRHFTQLVDTRICRIYFQVTSIPTTSHISFFMDGLALLHFDFQPYFASSCLKRLDRGLFMTLDFRCSGEYNFLFSLNSYDQAVLGLCQRVDFPTFEYLADTFWIPIWLNVSVIFDTSLFARVWHRAMTL